MLRYVCLNKKIVKAAWYSTGCLYSFYSWWYSTAVDPPQLMTFYSWWSSTSDDPRQLMILDSWWSSTADDILQLMILICICLQLMIFYSWWSSTCRMTSFIKFKITNLNYDDWVWGHSFQYTIYSVRGS